ncbi:hypothetical protein A3A95_04475 [Candidatus Nomurabacteria bacterium RIFCSPLOWO2_01_FULL_39_18]|uniref:Peptidoglycan binding-like domain-containing protein n=1 Tax=Candidatus Nomurabacteria bacterium RIFCSPHIGHO2_01_FULL_40_24b TaxID=1801739 RepID=A0A1F6V636_9BACT|nr:MAG: hypothetical protein A2647_04050 [Candidatus Nomurabacteria bacterium RIFCSPHIGHO2_01_FULL_40_24b]OGI89352.1 MAG: hypothetical protein A3A95_04475 [Candidatus Nomurabacteria bacterium RIFCSPLOWO2_01_FULL_39_18]
MENFKFTIFAIVGLVAVGLLGYWSLVSIESGTEHAAREKIEQLQKENEELKTEVESLKNELSQYQPEEKPAPSEEQNIQPGTVAPVYEHQVLIDELEKLITDNVVIKLKSRGTRVGTIQKFLNIYNGTSNRVDNDYGASTQKAVMGFQKASGLPSDGEAGKTTFEKMIEWLKKQ